jgi:hypothetical protein
VYSPKSEEIPWRNLYVIIHFKECTILLN